MEAKVKDQFKVSPSLVFFLIHSVQVGIGILSFQRAIVKYAGFDAWISIPIAGLAVHVIIWMMYKILNYEKSDLVAIHRRLFGKWIGHFLSLLIVIYYMGLVFLILRIYIEVVQVWMFPRINVIMLGFVISVLLYYIVSGGFKVVTGISYLGVVIPFYLILTLIFPLEFAHYDNLLPIMTHSITSLLMSAKEMVLSFLGFSTLLFYYPFIKKPETSQKYAHFAVILTVFIYLATCLVSFVFYSEDQMSAYLWPTLQLWKIVQMPFVERFEYIGLSSWVLALLPNMSVILWASSRGIKRVFNFNQKKTLIILLLLLISSMALIKGHDQIEKISNFLSNIGIIICFVYIPILFIIIMIKKRVRKSR